MCVHLEEEMGRLAPHKSIKAYPFRNIENFPTRITDDLSAQDAEAGFRNRLQRFNLDDIIIEIMVLRFVYDMTIRDISQELMIPSPMTTLNLLNRGLKELSEVISE